MPRPTDLLDSLQAAHRLLKGVAEADDDPDIDQQCFDHLQSCLDHVKTIGKRGLRRKNASKTTLIGGEEQHRSEPEPGDFRKLVTQINPHDFMFKE